MRVFEVGGSIRDRILGLKSKDIDYAVEAPSWDAMRQMILDRGGEIFVETPKYLTIRAKLPILGAADFALCRKDGTYTDGRHPDEVLIGTINEDLQRRDFTCNSIAKDCDTGEILDPNNGRQDLEEKKLNFVGDAFKRLKEDKLRAFRAVRFAVTKHLQIGKQANHALSELDTWEFEAISVERIREEMFKTFEYDTEIAMHCFFKLFPTLGEVALQKGIWLQPTIRAK